MAEARGRKGGGNTGGSPSIPQVTGLTAVEAYHGQVALEWNPIVGATTYWVNRDGYTMAIVTQDYFLDAYAGAGQTHTYKIAPVVNSTLGPWSANVTITTST